jgi:hypothetical protein
LACRKAAANRLRDDDVRLHELYEKEVKPKESGGPGWCVIPHPALLGGLNSLYQADRRDALSKPSLAACGRVSKCLVRELLRPFNLGYTI